MFGHAKIRGKHVPDVCGKLHCPTRCQCNLSSLNLFFSTFQPNPAKPQMHHNTDHGVLRPASSCVRRPTSYALRVLRPLSHVLRVQLPTPCVLRPASRVLRLASCVYALCPTSYYVLCPTSDVLRLTSCVLRPARCEICKFDGNGFRA